MRLQSALSMDEFQGIEDFGRLFRDKEEREERRDERRSRRRRRKRKRGKRKTARLRRRLDKLDSGRGGRRRKGGRGRKRGAGPGRPRKVARRGGASRSMVPAQRYDEGMSPEFEDASQEPWPTEVLEPEILDSDFDDDYEQFLQLEGMGAVQRRWSPKVQMGPNFRLQAAQGYRAAVIELKPGLFIVAELPEHVVRSEFGVLPLLAPLVVRAASRAIAKPPEQRMLPKLLKAVRQQNGQPQGQGQGLLQRMFRPKPAAAPAQLPAGQAQPQLPVVQSQVQPRRRLVPAPGAGRGRQALMPAPVLGRWVDEDDLAGLFGCDDDGNCDCGG